jgi:hypothetical protein
MKARLTILVLSLIVVASAKAPSATAQPTQNPTWPPTFVGSSSSAPGSTTITVTFDGTNATDEDVAITATSGMFSSIPSSVTVPANQNYVSFSATISSSASGSFVVTATNALGSVNSQTYYLPPAR